MGMLSFEAKLYVKLASNGRVLLPNQSGCSVLLSQLGVPLPFG